MASQTRQAREADRKLSVQTLAIASISSAAAAIIVSQFWKSGTAPAAAITPVVITVLSELLHKPTQAITSRVTGERTALLAEGAGAGAPAQKTEVAVGAPAADHEAAKPASEERPPPLRDEDGDSVPSDERASREAPISYHKAGSNGGPPSTFESLRKRVSMKIVVATAALAFVIGAAILTVPELITGGSVGKTSGGTTLFGGDRSSNTTDEGTETDRQAPDEQDQQNQPEQQDQNSSDSESKSKKPSTTTEQKTTPKTETQQQPQQRQAPAPSKTPAQP